MIPVMATNEKQTSAIPMKPVVLPTCRGSIYKTQQNVWHAARLNANMQSSNNYDISGGSGICFGSCDQPAAWDSGSRSPKPVFTI